MIFILSCATRYIEYDRNTILKKYSAKYSIFIDDQKIDLTNVYLDKNNIENILIDKKTKKLNIKQYKKARLIEIQKLNQDSLSGKIKEVNKRKIDLIIIDGIVLDDHLNNKIKVDLNAIKSLSIISKEKLNNDKLICGRHYNGDLMLINTK